MNRYAPLALSALAVMVTTAVQAQDPSSSFNQSAAGNFLLRQQAGALGTGYTIDSVNNQVLARARAMGASNGVRPVGTTNTSIPSAPRLAQLPSIGGGEKPFANASNGSTISPYLNLFNTGRGGGQQSVDNYNVLVRPQLDQQRTNQQLQRQQQQLNLRVQSISAKPAFDAAGSEQVMATGHQTTYGYYSHFYPGKNRRR